MTTPGLIQGGRGNLPNTHFWHILNKSHQRAPQKFKMAKCTLKWQHLDSGREGKSTKYSLLAYFEKKSPKKPRKDLKWLNVLRINGNTWRVGKSTKYSLLAYFEKKPAKSPFISKRLRNSILATPGLNREGRGGSTKYPLMAYFEKKPPKNGAKMAKTDWQREFVYRTSDMLVLLPKTSRSCCS